MLDHSSPSPAELLAAALRASDDAERARLADLVGAAARAIAPDDVAPVVGPAGDAWRALVRAADALHGAGVHAMGRPAFLSEGLLAMLAAEGVAQRPRDIGDGARATAGAGDALARVAASRQLREAVSAAAGAALRPTLDALYEYDGPLARVRTHVDGDGWPIVCHVLVAHDGPHGPAASELVAHVPEAPAPVRLRLVAGEGVLIRGRGTLHAWAPLGPGEHRTLAAIGFRAAD